MTGRLLLDRQGVDFERFIDLSKCFCSWNDRYSNMNYFSLRHEAYGLLGETMNSTIHDPTEDARISMLLYTRFVKPGGHAMTVAKEKLKSMRYRRQLPRANKIEVDGICSAAYNPRYCTCGQPTLSDND